MLAGESSVWESHVIQYDYPDGSGTERILPVAAIYGANASGKTNLLHAVFNCLYDFLFAPLRSLGDPISNYDPFHFDLVSRKQPVYYGIEFLQNGRRFIYEIEFDAVQVSLEKLTLMNGTETDATVLFERIVVNAASHVHKVKVTSPNKDQIVEVFANQPMLPKFGLDLPDEIITNAYLFLKQKIWTVVPNSKGHEWFLGQKTMLRSAKDPKFHARLTKLLQNADGSLQGFEVNEINSGTYKNGQPQEKEIRLTHKLFENFQEVGLEFLDFKQESKGTQTLFAIGGMILEALESGLVLFIDELELSLHPYISRMLVSLFQDREINSKNAQLIFTTHNPKLLDYRLLRKDQIFFVEKDKTGNSSMFSLNDFEDVAYDVDFEQIYLNGRLGAIPTTYSIQSIFED